MNRFTIVLLISLLCVLGCGGSNIAVREGSFGFLKGQTELKVEYQYDGMRVGKFTEEQYIKDKVTEYNSKEQGKGDTWRESWKGDRARRFQPKFEDLLNKFLQGRASVSSNATNAKYTLILKTVFTEPGFNVAIVRKSASIDVEITFVETANPSRVMASLAMSKVPGSGALGFDFDAGLRIQESYALCGKRLGEFLVKNF
jgi:hypothetical protein